MHTHTPLHVSLKNLLPEEKMYYGRALRLVNNGVQKTCCFQLFHEYYWNWLAYFSTLALCECLHVYTHTCES